VYEGIYHNQRVQDIVVIDEIAKGRAQKEFGSAAPCFEARRFCASWHASSPSAAKCVTAQAEEACVGEEMYENIVGRCTKTSLDAWACAEDVDYINSFLNCLRP